MDRPCPDRGAPLAMIFLEYSNLRCQDFESWGLSPGAKLVARALQQYGMYLCDNGGDMALQLQLLDRETEVNRKKWDDLSPGLYTSISKIPTDQFRLLDTGKPISGGAADRVTTPLIVPQCGTFRGKVKVTMKVNQHWPDAVIRYTLDGSTPTATSLLYKEPFLLHSSKMIKARAFHPNGKDSHVMRTQIFVE